MENWESYVRIPDSRKPVSYTHLDVYKRQVYKCTEEGRAAFMRFVDTVNA